jgi:hypothetical protein
MEPTDLSVAPFAESETGLPPAASVPVGVSLLDGSVGFNMPVTAQGVTSFNPRTSGDYEPTSLGQKIRTIASIPLGFTGESDLAYKLSGENTEPITGFDVAKAGGALAADAAAALVSPVRAAGGAYKLGRTATRLGKLNSVPFQLADKVALKITNPWMGKPGARVGANAAEDAIDGAIISLAASAADERDRPFTEDMGDAFLSGAISGGAGFFSRLVPFTNYKNKTMQGTVSQDKDATLRAVGNTMRLTPRGEFLEGTDISDIAPWATTQTTKDVYEYSAQNPLLTLEELRLKSRQDATKAGERLNEKIKALNLKPPAVQRVSRMERTYTEGGVQIDSRVERNALEFDTHAGPTAESINPNLDPAMSAQINADASAIANRYLEREGWKKVGDHPDAGTIEYTKLNDPDRINGGYINSLRDAQRKINAMRVETMKNKDSDWVRQAAAYKLASNKISAQIEALSKSLPGEYTELMREAASAYARADLFDDMALATLGSDPGMTLRPFLESMDSPFRGKGVLGSPVEIGQIGSGLVMEAPALLNEVLNTKENLGAAQANGGSAELRRMLDAGIPLDEALGLLQSSVYNPVK